MMNEHDSTYLRFLPAIYQQEEKRELLDAFLLAFEHVLSGSANPANPGLEEILEGIGAELGGFERYFEPGPQKSGITGEVNPADGCQALHSGEPEPPPPEKVVAQRVPAEFLEWLSGWVALALREDWSEEEQRRIIANMVQAYRQRGTPEGLRKVLLAYTDLGAEEVEFVEHHGSMKLGVRAELGKDAVLGEGRPHYFVARVRMRPKDLPRLPVRLRVLRAIIDREKPAHTHYDLEPQVATLQIKVRSTVGYDTALGTLKLMDQECTQGDP